MTFDFEWAELPDDIAHANIRPGSDGKSSTTSSTTSPVRPRPTKSNRPPYPDHSCRRAACSNASAGQPQPPWANRAVRPMVAVRQPEYRQDVVAALSRPLPVARLERAGRRLRRAGAIGC